MSTKRIIIGFLTALSIVGFAPPANAGCCVEWPVDSPGLKYCRQQGAEREQACSGDGRSWRADDCSAVADCTDSGKCLYGDNKSQCADERRWQCDQRGGVANVDFFPNQSCAAPAQAGLCCVTRAGDTTVCYDASTFPKVENQTACESRGDVVRFESTVCSSVVECRQASPAEPSDVGLPLPAFIPAIPQLIIPIPGFKGFSEIKVIEAGETRTLDIPFIAEYIQAIYNYVLGIVGIIATVMIVYGGIRWLTAAGNPTMIGAAKTSITNAVIGIIIALGSYLILFTINPELVRLHSLQITFTTQQELEGESNSFSSSGSITSSPGDGGSYRAIAERVAQSLGFNGCLFSRQIGMESNWNPNAGSSCCHGLGAVHTKSAKGILNNQRKRQELISLHSQGCPSCPPQNADTQTIASWLKSDPEGNLIVSGMLRRDTMRSAPNPIATTGSYGFGIGTYRNYVRSTSCAPVRFSEDELLNKLRSGVSPNELITQSCIPPVTWPLARSGLNCPGSNKCCRSATGACEQPSFSPQGRIGVCQGGTRDGQQCAAVAGGETYIRTYISLARRCTQ